MVERDALVLGEDKMGLGLSNTNLHSWAANGATESKDSMVYVQRDAMGRLLRVEEEPFEGMNDTLALESPELQSWLKVRLEVKAQLDQLKQTDLDMIRVLEDALYLLIDHGVIKYAELPEAARRKLDQRALARADLEGLIDHPESR